VCQKHVSSGSTIFHFIQSMESNLTKTQIILWKLNRLLSFSYIYHFGYTFTLTSLSVFYLSCFLKLNEIKGKWSTAQNSFARKPVFQPNPKIRCIVLDNFQKNFIYKKRDILEFFEQMNFEQMIPTQIKLAILKICLLILFVSVPNFYLLDFCHVWRNKKQITKI
jgi:hypothetical protein